MSWWDPLVDLFGEGSPQVDSGGDGLFDFDFGGDVGASPMDFGGEGIDFGGDVPMDFGGEGLFESFGDESIYSAPVGEVDVTPTSDNPDVTPGEDPGAVPEGGIGQPDLARETARAASMRDRPEPPSTLTRLMNALSDVAPRLARGFEGAKAGGTTAISLFAPPDLGTISPLRSDSPASLPLPEAPASRAFTPYNPEASTPVGAIERLLRGRG